MSTKWEAESNQRAINKLRTMSGGSRADSERDSGFSDASSEHTSTMGTTESEDYTRRTPQQGVKRGTGPMVSQLAVVGGPSYPNMSSMIIMNNVLLNQQPSDSPKPLKPWGFRPAVEVVQPVGQQPQVVFLQPMVSHQTPPSRKDHSSRHRRPKKYLPLLKSYPKIAPHPGDSSSSSSGRGTASSSSSSSMSSSSSSSRSKRGAKLTSGHREHSHRGKRHHQRKKSQSGAGRSSTSGPTDLPAFPGGQSLKPLPSAESDERLAPAASATASTSFSGPAPSPAATPQPQALPVPSPRRPHSPATGCDEGSAGPGDPETKRMRFCNTYNILSKSGLLDITLKTKELLRQNQRTQSELDRLKEHTELFVQALQSGDPGVVLKLQARLQEEEVEEEVEESEADGRARDVAKDD